MKPDVYKYLDYRLFLVDAFNAKNEKDESFSFRTFARMAGSSSPNYLQLIRDRKINIQDDAISPIAKGLELKKKEEEFLRVLVRFDQSKTHAQKDVFFQAILQKREYKSIKTLTTEHYQFFSHWYIPVIRELIVRKDYPDDISWLEKIINPPISDSKIRKGIKLLSKLDLIKKNKTTSKWEQTNRVISTASEVFSHAIIKYHRDVIALASEAIERFKKPERDIRSITIGLSDKGLKEAKKRLESFWKEMLDFGDSQQNVTRVFQLNTQLFPLSDEDKKK